MPTPANSCSALFPSSSGVSCCVRKACAVQLDDKLASGTCVAQGSLNCPAALSSAEIARFGRRAVLAKTPSWLSFMPSTIANAIHDAAANLCQCNCADRDIDEFCGVACAISSCNCRWMCGKSSLDDDDDDRNFLTSASPFCLQASSLTAADAEQTPTAENLSLWRVRPRRAMITMTTTKIMNNELPIARERHARSQSRASNIAPTAQQRCLCGISVENSAKSFIIAAADRCQQCVAQTHCLKNSA